MSRYYQLPARLGGETVKAIEEVARKVTVSIPGLGNLALPREWLTPIKPPMPAKPEAKGPYKIVGGPHDGEFAMNDGTEHISWFLGGAWYRWEELWEKVGDHGVTFAPMVPLLQPVKRPFDLTTERGERVMTTLQLNKRVRLTVTTRAGAYLELPFHSLEARKLASALWAEADRADATDD